MYIHTIAVHGRRVVDLCPPTPRDVHQQVFQVDTSVGISAASNRVYIGWYIGWYIWRYIWWYIWWYIFGISGSDIRPDIPELGSLMTEQCHENFSIGNWYRN